MHKHQQYAVDLKKNITGVTLYVVTKFNDFNYQTKDGFALKTHGIFLDHGAKVNISYRGQRQNTGVEVAIMAAKFGQEILSSINALQCWKQGIY